MKARGARRAEMIYSGSWLLAPGSWLLAPGSWLLAPGSWLLASGSWLLAPGSWLLAPGFWLLASGFWLRFLFQSQFRGSCHFDEGSDTLRHRRARSPALPLTHSSFTPRSAARSRMRSIKSVRNTREDPQYGQECRRSRIIPHIEDTHSHRKLRHRRT